MKGKRFTEEQIALAMRQLEGGTAVAEIVRKMGTSEQTFYRPLVVHFEATNVVASGRGAVSSCSSDPDWTGIFRSDSSSPAPPAAIPTGLILRSPAKNTQAVK